VPDGIGSVIYVACVTLGKSGPA